MVSGMSEWMGFCVYDPHLQPCRSNACCMWSWDILDVIRAWRSFSGDEGLRVEWKKTIFIFIHTEVGRLFFHCPWQWVSHSSGKKEAGFSVFKKCLNIVWRNLSRHTHMSKTSMQDIMRKKCLLQPEKRLLSCTGSEQLSSLQCSVVELNVAFVSLVKRKSKEKWWLKLEGFIYSYGKSESELLLFVWTTRP